MMFMTIFFATSMAVQPVAVVVKESFADQKCFDVQNDIARDEKNAAQWAPGPDFHVVGVRCSQAQPDADGHIDLGDPTAPRKDI